jgi:hypothetical protein
MRLIRSALSIAIGLNTFIAGLTSPHAETPSATVAASYIRTLFDATLPAQGGLGDNCDEVTAFGRFAAGHLWRALPDIERLKFAGDFCQLAGDAVARLHRRFPGLSLTLLEARAAAQDMVTVNSQVKAHGVPPWTVNWLVADQSGQPLLADLRVIGISIGIFLRSTAALETPQGLQGSLTSDAILAPWRRALDRALPITDAGPGR